MWKANINATQFSAALTGVHEARGQGAIDYAEVCKNCAALYRKKDSNGCKFHAGRPNLYRIGNPMRSKKVKNFIVSFYKHNSHLPKSCSQVCPSEMLQLRNRLLTSGRPEDYILFVFVLLGIKMFLRVDDLANLAMESLIPSLCTMKDGFVSSLTFRVEGKSEKRAKNNIRKNRCVYITIYRDDKVTELCPVRHLLAYIHLADISTGFIFPSNSKGGGKMNYASVNERIKRIMEEVTGRSGNFTTHFIKKSAVLFGVWGKAPLDDLMKACRHKHVCIHISRLS